MSPRFSSPCVPVRCSVAVLFSIERLRLPADLKPFIHNNKFTDRTTYDITLWIFGQIAVADPPAGLTRALPHIH